MSLGFKGYAKYRRNVGLLFIFQKLFKCTKRQWWRNLYKLSMVEFLVQGVGGSGLRRETESKWIIKLQIAKSATNQTRVLWYVVLGQEDQGFVVWPGKSSLGWEGELQTVRAGMNISDSENIMNKTGQWLACLMD